jgi:hypothetical protein
MAAFPHNCTFVRVEKGEVRAIRGRIEGYSKDQKQHCNSRKDLGCSFEMFPVTKSV